MGPILMQQSRRIFALGFGLVASLGFTVGALAQGTPARELTVASSATYAPFAFENKDKQIVGFDIDGVRLAGSRLAPYACSIKGVLAEEARCERGWPRRNLSNSSTSPCAVSPSRSMKST